MKSILFSRVTTLTALALFFANSGSPARACAACYGDTSGDLMGNAATWGIIAMTILMFIMLGAVAGFGFYLKYRAEHPLPDYDELLSEDTDKPSPESAS